MRCERCQGGGFVKWWSGKDHYGKTALRLVPSYGLDPAAELCEACGGSGVAHCCEGDQEQPKGDDNE